MAKKDYSTLSNHQLISIIEKFEEKRRYGLVWDNERVPENVVTDCQISLPVLSEVTSKEITTDHTSPTHILIEGDNYHALSVLNYTHKNKIDLIYIDPPYNTGEDDFKYNDKFVDKLDGFRHSKWLNFISKRLELAKNLLKETGVIIIHIDENEFINLGSLLQSNVFDENNNLGTIIWNKQNPKGDAKGISTMHEYLFCYAKNKEAFLKLDNAVTRKKPNAVKILNKAKTLYSKIGKKQIPEEVKSVIKPFKYPKSVLVDFIVKYDLKLVNQEFQSWMTNQDFSAGEKAYKYIDQYGEVYRGVSMAWPNKDQAPTDYFIPLIHPVTKKACPVPARGWRNPPSTMKGLLKKDLILFGIDHNKQPERKYLLKENMNENTPSIYNYGSSDDDFFSKIGISFPYAKPVEVAKYLISSIHPNAKVILDFFAGSGTTGQAVIELNKEDGGDRQFIICTNNENNIAEEITYPRLKMVYEGLGSDDQAINSNLKYYKTSFVKNHKNQDQLKFDVAKKCTEMLCIKEGIFNLKLDSEDYKIYEQGSRYLAVYYDFPNTSFYELKEQMNALSGDKVLYCFTLDSDSLDQSNFEDWADVRVEPIPQKILEVYKRIFKRKK